MIFLKTQENEIDKLKKKKKRDRERKYQITTKVLHGKDD